MTDAEKPKQQRSRHGMTAPMARIKLRGLHAIDTRTIAARSLLDWQKRLIADLGGVDAVSSAQSALVDTAVRTKALLDHADAFLLSQKSIINRRSRSFYPIVRERQALADSLARVLGQLGLEKHEPPAGLALESFIERVKPIDDSDDEPPERDKNAEPEEREG
jgi:hypothetical protein